MAIARQKACTIDDIYALPEGQRAELIDWQIYMMAPPRRIHQELVSQFTKIIGQHIDTHNGICKVYPAPFAVFLNSDDRNYVEPDLAVICDQNKLDEYGCNGAPDWIIEIVSPSSQRMDYGIKLFKYRTAGVREYWIVNPITHIINVFDFEHGEKTGQYTFDEDISACIYKDLTININKLLGTV